MTKAAKLTIKKLGDELVVPLPADIADDARLASGDEVEMTVEGPKLVIQSVKAPEPTLEELLAQFDPELHGGEAMATTRVGREVI